MIVKNSFQNRNDGERECNAYQSLAAPAASVDLLSRKAQGQQSERPRNHGGGSGACQALSAPYTDMMHSCQHGRQTNHAGYQRDDDEPWCDHVSCQQKNNITSKFKHENYRIC